MHPVSRLAVFWLAATACHHDPPPTPNPPAEEPARPPRDGDSIHFTRLKPFLPAELDGFHGGELKASTSQFGGVAVSEIERFYEREARRAEIRILDTNLNRKEGAALKAQASEVPHGRPFSSGPAQGYVSFDPERRYAQASIVVADRFVVGVTIEDARDDREAEGLVRALDLTGLGKLAAPHPQLAAPQPQ
jgi:hypothetical protein